MVVSSADNIPQVNHNNHNRTGTHQHFRLDCTRLEPNRLVSNRSALDLCLRLPACYRLEYSVPANTIDHSCGSALPCNQAQQPTCVKVHWRSTLSNSQFSTEFVHPLSPLLPEPLSSGLSSSAINKATFPSRRSQQTPFYLAILPSAASSHPERTRTRTHTHIPLPRRNHINVRSPSDPPYHVGVHIP
jgi:hypothetical protein